MTAAVWRLIGASSRRSSSTGLSGPPALQGIPAAVEAILRRVVLILQDEELASGEFCKHNAETDTPDTIHGESCLRRSAEDHEIEMGRACGISRVTNNQDTQVSDR